MRAVLLDKIASVTQNCALRRDVRVSDDYPCQEGDVLAVRVLTRKSTYNDLELTNGRMSKLNQGDVIAGALGHRHALQGYAGHIPARIKTGDTLNLLNMGGVLGLCTSFSPMVGPPHEVEVLGSILSFPVLTSRQGTPANIATDCPPLDDTVSVIGPPVIAVVGTSMNSGKTEACHTLVQQFGRRGLTVAGAKATGVSLRRDVLAMQDAGATNVSVFTDFGIVTTQPKNAPAVTRSMLNHLSADRPDVIVLELGDGLVGDYGVAAILDDPAITGRLSAVVLAATDPVGAWGGVSILRDRHGLEPLVVTGPATDNEAGVQIIQRETGVTAINVRHNAAQIAEILVQSMGAARV